MKTQRAFEVFTQSRPNDNGVFDITIKKHAEAQEQVQEDADRIKEETRLDEERKFKEEKDKDPE